MSAIAASATVAQLVAVAVGAPMVTGIMRQTRAKMEGRAGPGFAQPWRELRKLAGKERIRPAGTTVVFAAAPLFLAATTLAIAAIIPLVTTGSPLDRDGDLFAV